MYVRACVLLLCCCVRAALRLSAEFFHAELSVWESLCEPWSLRVQQIQVRWAEVGWAECGPRVNPCYRLVPPTSRCPGACIAAALPPFPAVSLVQPQPLAPNRQTVPAAFCDMGLWAPGLGDSVDDVTRKLSLQHADTLYRVEDDVVKSQYSLDVMDVVSDEVIARREALEKEWKAQANRDTQHAWAGWTEQHCINVSSLPADSLLTVVSKKWVIP